MVEEEISQLLIEPRKPTFLIASRRSRRKKKALKWRAPSAPSI